MNSRKTATSYLQSSSFSRSGLIKQLEYEGYSRVDAEYGVDAQNADWRTQAVKSAGSYLKSSAFSRSGLIKQLEYEGYSRADAEFAVDAQSADWRAQAAKSAASYLRISAFTYSGLISQLVYEGYSLAEATFGAQSSGLATTPTPTPTPTPQPIETGCQVPTSNSLPFSSQRITVTNVNWEKDSAGYVSGLLTMRNDNSMSLRLVQFTFLIISDYSVVRLAQTLQGDNFFIKDDPKFNSIDGQSGAWLAGQTRIFRLPTDQILKCSTISYVSAGFSVSLGIGDS
jgi:hypothetical protein